MSSPGDATVSPTPRAPPRTRRRSAGGTASSRSAVPDDALQFFADAVPLAMTASCLRFVVAYYVVFLGVVQYRFVLVHGDCWYDNKRHEENAEVPTGEPCLNCTCSKSALLCYLRVCTRLPDPPPAGCVLLHRYKTCCPELICSDFHDGGNSLEARADPEGDTAMDILSDDQSAYENACISNGSIYGPGSAMHSSSLCEYCYCLGGKQVCVKPKCLLPIEGCRPVFQDTSCCPARYNCTSDYILETHTEEATTVTSPSSSNQGGCLIDNTHYEEGSKIIGGGHSVCDNCYCLRGQMRCEPLSCAPPLLGCAPVVKPGDCCAASYNCNGSLEIEAEPNYGQFPTISKEYSKLRKEVQRRPPPKHHQRNKEGVVTVAPFYVLAETLQEPTTKLVYQRSPASHDDDDDDHSSKNYFLISSSSSSNKQRGGPYDEVENAQFRRVVSSTASEKEEKESSTDYFGVGHLNILGIVNSLLDNKMYYRRSDEGTGDNQRGTTLETTLSTTEVTDELSTSLLDTSTTPPNAFDATTPLGTTLEEEEEEEDNTNGPVTVTAVLKSTDCIRGIQQNGNPDPETTTTAAVDPAEVNALVESTTTDFGSDGASSETDSATDKPKIHDAKLPPDIEAILNIGKHKNREDFDYDYNEPTLPPSLPNLKIIPFVAADALDAKKESPKDPTPTFIEEKIDTGPLDYAPSNMFRPPVETEGGFVPKEPLIIDDFYDNVVSVPSMVVSSEPSVLNCIAKNREEIPHGTSVPSDSPCATCTCFYGNVVCQKAACPPPKPGCKVATTLCCPDYVDCDESAAEVPQEVVTPDPFKDVIRTEPAPNLESLIGDMILQKVVVVATTATPPALPDSPSPISSSTTTTPTTPGDDDESVGFDKVLQFIFSGQPDVIEKPLSQTPIKTNNNDATAQVSHPNVATHADNATTDVVATEGTDKKNPVGVGPLKLAGCNIYGRMYRVGRIISELSGPCRECKCTEVGVECRPLRCT